MLSDYNTVGFWDILCSDGCQYQDSGHPDHDTVVWRWRIVRIMKTAGSTETLVHVYHSIGFLIPEDRSIEAWLDLEMGLLI
jgi:hypothetical protein